MKALGEFERFLLWESTTRDTVDFKTIYVDIAEDLVAGLLLSQLVYWHLPNSEGQSKLQVYKDGHYWVAKKRTAWYDEIRITPKQADRAIKILETKGIIETCLHRFNGAPTTHLRIMPAGFLEAWRSVLSQRSKSICPKEQQPFAPDDEIEIDETDKSLTETVTETPSQSTAEDPAADAPDPPTAQKRLADMRARLGDNPLDLCANVAKAQAETGGVIWTVPVEAGGTDTVGNLMLDAWLEAKRIDPTVTPETVKQNFRQTFSKLAATMHSLKDCPDLAAQAVSVVLDPENEEFNYYTYSDPIVKKFSQDWTGVVLRLLSGWTGYLNDDHEHERYAPTSTVVYANDLLPTEPESLEEMPWLSPAPLPELDLFWRTCQQELEGRLTRATYYTWIRPLTIIDLDRAAGHATIRAPGPHHQDFIIKRFTPLLVRTLAAVAELPAESFTVTCLVPEPEAVTA